MPPTVYIETSVLSAYADVRDHPASRHQQRLTAEWWEHQSGHFELHSSLAVLTELMRVPFAGRDEALRLLRQTTFLPITESVRGVADVYGRHLVMPRGPVGDAVHLAVACVNEVDYLLTWNCRHLANTNKVRHIQTINNRLGLLTPHLVTPEMLVSEEDAHDG